MLRGVNFDFDKADIRPDAAVILDEAASLLNSNPGRAVSVGGHTDSVGTDVYNQSLSERRANVGDGLPGGQGSRRSRLSRWATASRTRSRRTTRRTAAR